MIYFLFLPLYILETNKDILPDDIVSMFSSDTCNFGFITHLFAAEVKSLFSQDALSRRSTFRICPTSSQDQDAVATLSQDFHTRLNHLLRTLVHARPHFIRCICPNKTESSCEFNRDLVRQQVRSLQVLETLNLMSDGFPHRMRFNSFIMRYKAFNTESSHEMSVLEVCRSILKYLSQSSDKATLGKDWALGKKHVFLSEGMRQRLEQLRTLKRSESATLIQAVWRGHSVRKTLTSIDKKVQIQWSRSRSWPIEVNTKFERVNLDKDNLKHMSEQNNMKLIENTCLLFGLDFTKAPPLPPSRSYTVFGNSKITYPQTRIMKISFPGLFVNQIKDMIGFTTICYREWLCPTGEGRDCSSHRNISTQRSPGRGEKQSHHSSATSITGTSRMGTNHSDHHKN